MHVYVCVCVCLSFKSTGCMYHEYDRWTGDADIKRHRRCFTNFTFGLVLAGVRVGQKVPPCVWGVCDFHVNLSWLHVSRIRPTHWRLNDDFNINQRRHRLLWKMRICMCVCVLIRLKRTQSCYESKMLKMLKLLLRWSRGLLTWRFRSGHDPVYQLVMCQRIIVPEIQPNTWLLMWSLLKSFNCFVLLFNQPLTVLTIVLSTITLDTWWVGLWRGWLTASLNCVCVEDVKHRRWVPALTVCVCVCVHWRCKTQEICSTVTTGRLVTENAVATDISPLCPTIQSGSLFFRSFKYFWCNYISSPNKVITLTHM